MECRDRAGGLIAPTGGVDASLLARGDPAPRGPCASKYRLSVRADSSSGPEVFTNAKVFASRVAFPFFQLDPGTYAWRVKACNGKQCRSSPWRTFVPVTLPRNPR